MLKLKLQYFSHLMWRTGKDPDAGKNQRREEKGTTEDEMAGWHHQLDGHEFEQAPGVGDGQGGLACRSPWGLKELDTTEQLNWTEHILRASFYGYLNGQDFVGDWIKEVEKRRIKDGWRDKETTEGASGTFVSSL